MKALFKWQTFCPHTNESNDVVKESGDKGVKSPPPPARPYILLILASQWNSKISSWVRKTCEEDTVNVFNLHSHHCIQVHLIRWLKKNRHWGLQKRKITKEYWTLNQLFINTSSLPLQFPLARNLIGLNAWSEKIF